MERFRFVIITGMSGAGKTNFMQKLEDMGYYCVDNLPPVLIARFADLCWKSTANTRHVAVVSDIRGGTKNSCRCPRTGGCHYRHYRYETG